MTNKIIKTKVKKQAPIVKKQAPISKKQEPIVKIAPKKIVPSATLTQYEKKLWNDILDNHPIDFFEPYHSHLITQYCKCLGQADELNTKLSDGVYKNVADLIAIHRLKNTMVLTASSLATRLRLTIQSNTPQSTNTNGKKNKVHAAVPRPWDEDTQD